MSIETLLVNFKELCSKWFYQKEEVDSKLNTKAGTSTATISTNGLMSSSDKAKLDDIAESADAVSFSRTLNSGTKIGTLTINGNTIDLYCNNDTTYGIVTTSTNGLMSSTDKVKLDGISAGATKVTVDSAMSSSSTNPVQNKVVNTALSGKASTSVATTSAHGLMSASDKSKLDGITASADAVSFSRSLTSGTKIGTLTINGSATDLYSTNNTTYSAATTSAAGLMSSSDKSKLDGIATGANKTTVDSVMSSSSTNPVQNKVIQSQITSLNNNINGKANSSHTHTVSQISDLTVSTYTLGTNAKLYKYGKIVLAVFNGYSFSGKTAYQWTDIFNIPSGYRPISTDNIYGHWSGNSTAQILAGSNKISIYPSQSSGSVFGHILWVIS